MKTSILYDTGKYLARASLPNETTPPKAILELAHDRTWRSFDGSEHKEHVQDLVWIGYHTFAFKNDLTRSVRIIPDEYIVRLDDLDNQIENLGRERQHLIDEAWRRAKPLHKADLEEAIKTV